jgi:hypothetical protein
LYYKIINGKVESIEDVTYDAAHRFYTQLIETPPSFSASAIPSDYTSSDISIKITNAVNNLDCSVNHGTFDSEKFYDDDKPGEYKLLENMGELREENGNIKRLFNKYFCLISPEKGENFIKGELSYTQILTDLHSGKTETADVKITYDLDFGFKKEKISGIIIYLNIYKRVIYTILEEDSNNIHYKADITIFDNDKNLTAEDKKISSSSKSDILINRYFRLK